MSKRPATVDDIMATLQKRPSLLFDVLQVILGQEKKGGWKIVGEWVGPKIHVQGTGESIEYYQRLDPTDTVIASIRRRVDELPPRDWHWVTRGDVEGHEPNLDSAKTAADVALELAGWTVVNGPPLIAGPWVKKTNHWCREMLSGSLRNRHQHTKVAVVRVQAPVLQVSWGVLSRADPDDILYKGSFPDGKEAIPLAQLAADDALRKAGWLLFDD